MYKWTRHIKLHKRAFLVLIGLMILVSLGTSLPYSVLESAKYIGGGDISEGDVVVLAIGIVIFALFLFFAILFWRGVFIRRSRPWVGALFQTVLIYIAGAVPGGLAIGGIFEALRQSGAISYESGMIGIELCSAFLQGIVRVLVIYFALSRLYQVSMRRYCGVFWKVALIAACLSLVGGVIGLFLFGLALWIFGFLLDAMIVVFSIIWLDIPMREYAA